MIPLAAVSSFKRVYPDEPTAKAVGSRTRVWPVGVTEQAARDAASSLPVTRLSDLTPLDRLGIPVYCAVTPLARDLTTHMGKGETREAARVSALMEAIERITAETAVVAIRARACDLSGSPKPIDPLTFDLPPDTSFRPDAEIDWSEGVDLIGMSPILVPSDLVICPPRDGVITQPDTNGLASGNTRLEAAVHGLCEVIERDAMGRWAFAGLYADGSEPDLARPIDLSTLPEAGRRILDIVVDARLELEVSLLESNIAVPAIHAILVDPAYPSAAGTGRRRFDGFGCHPDAEVALVRALNEAAQSRLAIIQGARDSFNRLPIRLKKPDDSAGRRVAVDPIAFQTIPTFRSGDLGDDLTHLLEALTRAGLRRVLSIDLTNPDPGVCVVRIRVPGLSSFFVDRSRVGWRTLAQLV